MVFVTGVGNTEYAKKIGRSAEVLAVEATRKAAAADAGIVRRDRRHHHLSRPRATRTSFSPSYRSICISVSRWI